MAIVWIWARAANAVKLAAWALFVAYLMEPLVSRLQKRMGRGLAALLAFLIVLGAVACAVCAVLLPALSQLSQLPLVLARAASRAQASLGAFLQRARISGFDLARINLFSGADAISGFAARAVSALLSGAGSAVTALSEGMVVCALSVFYLLDWKCLTLRLAMLVPGVWRAKTIRAANAVRRELGVYVRAQITIMLAVSLLAICALALARAPMPLAMGLMYGLLNAIPYFGPFVGAIPPVVAALSLGWRRAVLTLAVLLLIQQIDNYALSPRVMGAASGASPAMVLLAIAAGSALGGVAGMLLALPALVALRALFRAFASKE